MDARPPLRAHFGTPGLARLGALLALAAIFTTLALALGRTPGAEAHSAPAAAPAPEAERGVVCRAELRSWIVAGRGRHMYLQIIAPEPFGELSGRIEYTTLALRKDYDPWTDTTGKPRIGRMTPGRALGPLAFGPPADNRLEARYELTVAQARALQRDRIFTEIYALLGANSSSGLRRTMEDAGLRMPDHILRAGGAMGEFPGVEFDPGPEIPRRDWATFGLKAAALSTDGAGNS
jgi:hypothetical protein